jgi:hypothetical protein
MEFYGQFGSTPVVFSQITSDDRNKALVTRQKTVATDGFACRLQAEEA